MKSFQRQEKSFVRQGEPADRMFVLLEGVFQWRGEFVGDEARPIVLSHEL